MMKMEEKSMTKPGKIYFNDLDVLRFFAAYAIVLFHGFYGFKSNFGVPSWMESEPGSLNIIGKLLERLIHNFSFGVDLFFLISGFLITYLLIAEKDKTGDVAIKKFYIRRAFRIWPLYFLLIAIGPLLTYMFNEPSPDYIWHLLFVGNFEIIANGYTSAATNHLWSICIEEHFYLICPLLIAFIPRKHLAPTLIGIVFLSIITRGYILSTPDYWVNMYMNTLARMDVLAIGALAGYLFYNNKLRFSDSRGVRYMVYGILIFMLFNDDIVYWDNPFLAMCKKYFYVFGFGYAMGNFLFNTESSKHFLKSEKLMYLGKMSYGIYMFNPVVICLLVKWFHMNQISNGYLFIAGLHIMLAVLVLSSYKFFEMPFLKLKEKFAVIESSSHARKVEPRQIAVSASTDTGVQNESKGGDAPSPELSPVPVTPGS